MSVLSLVTNNKNILISFYSTTPSYDMQTRIVIAYNYIDSQYKQITLLAMYSQYIHTKSHAHQKAHQPQDHAFLFQRNQINLLKSHRPKPLCKHPNLFSLLKRQIPSFELSPLYFFPSTNEWMFTKMVLAARIFFFRSDIFPTCIMPSLHIQWPFPASSRCIVA